jgi:hypothetical protein
MVDFERFFTVFQGFLEFSPLPEERKKRNTDSESATKNPSKTHVLQNNKKN